MRYEELAPPADLAGLVRCIWTLEGEGPSSPEPALPDGSPELIFSFADPFVHETADGRAVPQPGAFLVGQITRPMHVRATGAADLLAVRLEAHGGGVLHQPMSTLTDAWVPLSALLGPGAEGLVATQRSAGTEQRVEAVCAVLREASRRTPPAPPSVGAAVRAIRATPAEAVIATLAAPETPRTLQRHFLRHVGIGPKMLARIVRFQRVFAAWRDDPRSIARTAFACGYADQSHLVRDFRAFSGGTPASLLAALPQFTALLLGGHRQE
jgi:AraC-like DNA-binding protein